MRKVKVTGYVWAKVPIEFEMEVHEYIDLQQDGDVIRDMIMDYTGDYDIDMEELKESADGNWVDMEDIEADEIL